MKNKKEKRKIEIRIKKVKIQEKSELVSSVSEAIAKRMDQVTIDR